MLKDKVELFLNTYASNHPGVTVTVAKKSTGVYKNGVYQMYIYYRSDAIRVSVKPGTTQHGEYASLLRDHLVYQKDSANPYESNSFAFFVDEENIATVLQRLLESQALPTDEQMAEFAAHAQKNKVHKQQMNSERNNSIQAVPKGDANTLREVVVVQASENNQRIEKKLDSLIGAITTMYSEKSFSPPVEAVSPKDEDKRFRIEATSGNIPFLILRTKPFITGLIFALKLCSVGIGTNAERCRIFFADKNSEPLSKPQEVDVIPGEEYNCRFELKSSASEEKTVYLVVQGINAMPNEARQLIECPVKIAFAADFGL